VAATLEQRETCSVLCYYLNVYGGPECLHTRIDEAVQWHNACNAISLHTLVRYSSLFYNLKQDVPEQTVKKKRHQNSS
jgi:hypothetical protein